MTTTRTLHVASSPSAAGTQTSFGDGWGPIRGDLQVDTTNPTQWKVPSPAGTWRNMEAQVIQNAGATTWSHKFQKGGVTGNQVVTIPGTSTGWFSDGSHTDSTSAGDLINYFYTGGNFGNQHVVQNVIELESTTQASLLVAGNNASNFAFSTTTNYAPLDADHGSKSATEAGFNQLEARAAGTSSGLFIWLATSLGGALTGTVTFRKNVGNGNQVVSVGSASTGALQDGSHTDSLASGDFYDCSFVATGSGGNGRTFGMYFAGSSSVHETWNGSSVISNNGGATTALPLNINGQFGGGTPELNRQVQVLRAYTVANLRFWLRAASWGATSTGANMKVRKNGADGNEIVSLTPASVPAWYEDGSHSDSLSANDLVNTQWLVLTAAATQLIFARVGINLDDGSTTGGSTGTITQTFTGISQAASGGLGNTGTVAQTFTGFSQALSGFVKPVGSTVQTFSGITQAAVGELGNAGAIDQTFTGFSQAAVGAASAAGAIAQTFSGMTEHAEGEGQPGNPRTTQLVRLVPATGDGHARATQVARLTAAKVSAKSRATQVARLTVARILAEPRATQVVRLIVADGVPCLTQWTQCWRITRQDSQVFRFTSLDEDFTWGLEVFKTCGSLNPSASESSTALGSVGNIELSGIITADEITAADLYGGLFDDAVVEVWLVPYNGDAKEIPKRIAAGWTGKLSQEAEGTFKMEVVGPGARLNQQSLVQPIAPRCRWKFGDSRCTVDREARALTGCEVLFSINRGAFTADLNLSGSSGEASSGENSSGEEAGAQWPNGSVVWTSGPNTGQECDVKTVDFTTGQVVLWSLPVHFPESGDEFKLLPGCAQGPDDCKFYDNFDNFGGFPDVPGDDELQQTPDAHAS